MFHLKPYSLSRRFEAHFLVVARKCKSLKNSSGARQYLKNSLGNKKEAKVIEQILDILDEESFMLNNISNTKLITEGDILSSIWAPLLKKVLAVGGTIVRTKLGESISQYSQSEKQLQYINEKNIKAFKIDMRFIYDLNEIEYNVGAGEVAREMIDETKILHDKSKLLREGKDVLDGLLNTVIPEINAKNSIGMAIQIKGLSAQIISLNLTSTGLYVAKTIFKICFPKVLSELDDFSEGLKNIFYFAQLLEDNAKFYESAMSSRKRSLASIDNDYNHRVLK